MSNNIISTLEYYNFYEQNNFKSARGCDYKVKVSDKEGNIITLEKDGSLFAMVGLSLNAGQLLLLDKAHDDSVLAEVDFPNAGQITNCRFDEETSSIEFDIVTLNGDTQNVSIDVQSLVDIYEAGDGIEIGEKNPETGKKPISIKLTEGENLLKVDDSGLSISDDVTTDEELAAAVSGKADTEYVDEIAGELSGITEELSEKIDELSGAVETNTNDISDLDDEIGEIVTNVESLSGSVEELSGKVLNNSAELIEHDGRISTLENDVIGLNADIDRIDGDIVAVNERIDNLDIEAVEIEKITSGLPSTVKEAYILKNDKGEQLGDTILIYNDSSIESIDYVTVREDTGEEGQFLKIVYISASGGEMTTYVDLSSMIIENSFGDGLKVDGRLVSVKIDQNSAEFMSVSENGISIEGAIAFIAGLADTDSQQWSAITQTRAELEQTDAQLWTAVNNEISARTSDVSVLSGAIDSEASRAINRENEIASSVEQEMLRAISAETELSGEIASEKVSREQGDAALQDAIDEEASVRANADIDLSTSISGLSNRISGFESSLSAETVARIAKDNELEADINEIRETSATKEYVDQRDAEVLSTAISSAITTSIQYTDDGLDALENELKAYIDSGTTDLEEAISANTTKLNVLSEFKGVSGDDASNYDDSGNGIVDVLHREFHELEKSLSGITNPTLEKKNEYESAFGKYNVSNTGDSPAERTIFSIGIGTSDEDRKNGIEIREDGTVLMWVEGDFVDINDLLAMLSHEVY